MIKIIKEDIQVSGGNEGNFEHHLIQLLTDNFYWSDIDGDGELFTSTVDADYRDEIDNRTLKSILKSKNPMDKFYELLDYDDNYDFDYIFETLQKADRDFYNENEDSIKSFCHDHIVFELDYEHYLSQEMCVDILIDTGDANYEFTLNTPYNPNDLEDEASIIWLAKTQGYNKQQVIDAMNGTNTYNSKFLKSVEQEYDNANTGGLNALTFLIKLPLRDILDTDSSKLTDVEIGTNVRVGFVDFWLGGGSMVGIDLEKPIRIPNNVIDRIMPDVLMDYSIKDIYGVRDDWWS